MNQRGAIAYNKGKGVMIMATTLTEIAGKLVSVSDLSNGKAGKIFTDVQENNSEYIILKNNRPAAVLLSLKEYESLSGKSEKLDTLMEMVENVELLALAEASVDSPTVPFEEVLKKEGIEKEELERLAESVEFE